MRKLSAAVAAFAVLAALVGAHKANTDLFVLAVAAALCAWTTWRSADISSFMKIFAAIFSTETIVFGLAQIVQAEGLLPAALAPYTPPESMAVTVAVFSIVVYAVSRVPVVQEMTRIADLYFDQHDRGEARVWPLPRFTARESAIAIAMIVVLVLINQGQVGISVRLSFFNRDWFNAIQEKNAAEFWRQLLYVFTPWAFFYVAIAVIEFVVQSMLVIRWRRWLTEHYVQRWLGAHTHYGMTLAGGAADNPDQRIAEDVNRFINGGDEGYGIYSYSILLISTVSSLVSFSFVLWELSGNYPLPGTSIYIPGFLFWVVLAYATVGTVITHLIGRSLVGLYFDKQRREADFRFSLARLREYSEQIALLGGERAEEGTLLQRFRGIVFNYLAIVRKRKELMAFTATYGQLSPIIPYVITAPFYFAGRIQLGVMTQTASAFGRVEGALTFFITYYTSLAQYKSVLDRLASFDQAIDAARDQAHRTRVVSRAPARDLSARSHARFAGQWTQDRACRRTGAHAGTGGAAHRPVGIGQIHIVPRHRRRLALCLGRDRRAGGRARDARAATPLYPHGHARRGRRLSGRGRGLRPQRYRGRAGGGASWALRRAARRRQQLGPAPLGRRAAAHRHRPRAAGQARLAVPRRGDLGARREARG
jgi:putative ATP-binding cassette transporter